MHSKFRGVTYHVRLKKWQAQIQRVGIKIHLGYYDTQVEAALAYDRAARKYFKQSEGCNFPEGL